MERKNVIVHNKDNDYIFDEIVIKDETDIKKINGKYFCFKNISYRDLLNNGQIVKKGSECPLEYHKNCGKLDTLEQELCIKENEKCPLYDAGLGEQLDSQNYIYNENAKVYYNNDNYNKSDKKIIGRLILNDGQPCYNSTEKLWKQFSKEEGFKTHLQCEFEVFGNYEEKRYEERGSITYKRLYLDNLNSECQNLIIKDVNDKKIVHLYKREFFGINKECDQKYNLNENTYFNLHFSEKMEFYVLVIEGIIVTVFSSVYFIAQITKLIISIVSGFYEEDIISSKKSPKIECFFYCVYMVLLVGCNICHIVAYVRMTRNDLSTYNCSDPIINEIMRKGFEDILINIRYIKINLILDSCLFLGNLLALLMAPILEKFSAEDEPEDEKEDEEIDDNEEKSEEKKAEIPLSSSYPSSGN